MRIRWLTALFAIITLLGMITLLISVRSQPYGGWDAWAIWNAHAHMLYRSNNWHTLFQLSPNAHPDYPLLLPALVTSLWALYGHETLVVPAAVSLAFTIATGVLLFTAVRTLRGTIQALLATTFLVGTSTFLSAGATQYADIPFGAFVLATLMLLTLEARGQSTRWLPLAAGILAGCAVWTKNEGLLFVGVVTLVLIVFRITGQMSSRSIAQFGLGLAPFLVGIAYFRLFLTPPNDLLEPQAGMSLWTKILDPARYLLVAKTVGLWLPRFGRGVLALLVVYALLVGRTPYMPRAELLPLIVSGLVFCGYIAIYIITPYDVVWHIETSILRLLLHLWPSILFGMFVVLRSPNKVEQQALLKSQNPT